MTIGWDRVAGPFGTFAEAEAEQKRLGAKEHSITARVVNNKTEYTIEKMAVVECNREPLMFGMTWSQIQAKQMKRDR